MSDRQDLYTSVTDQLVAAMAAGAGEWKMPWAHTGTSVMRPASAVGRRYNGINRLILWNSADQRGYASGTWATYNQWAELGGQVRKGEKGTRIILWKTIASQSSDPDKAGDEGGKGRAFAKSFAVFNQSQVDNLDVGQTAEPRPLSHTTLQAQDYLHAAGVPIVYGQQNAFYRDGEDRIYMPLPALFDSELDLVSTLGHELAHATGHHSRLDRETLRDYASSIQVRAREELIAEISSSFLMADLGLAYAPRPDHAAYLAHWITHLQSDPKAIFKAAARAQQAVEWIHTAATRNGQEIPLAA